MATLSLTPVAPGTITLTVSGAGGTIPLAQEGQTPSQDPASWGTAAAGSLAVAARADHVHPLAYMQILANVGDYYELGSMTSSGQSFVEAQEIAVPFIVPYPMTFDQIGFGLQANGTTGSVVRMGIRNFQPATPATPGTVLLDAGTVATISGGGGGGAAINIAINQQLGAGIWWAIIATQGGAVTPAKFFQTSPVNGGSVVLRAPGTSVAGGGVGGANNYPYQSGTSGALPATFARSGWTSLAASPWMYLRRSA